MSASAKAEALHVLGKENDDLVRPVLAAIDKEFGTVSKTSFKKIETIISKVLRPSILGKRPWFGVEHIRDGYRFKTVIAGGATVANIGHALDRLLTAIPGARIIKSDPSMLFDPKDWGWRAAVFDLQMPNGQLVEWYMPIAELEGAKKAGGHQLFERWRDADLKKLGAAEAKALETDVAASRKLYGDAWAKALLRMGQDESAARASLDKALASSSGKILKDSAKSSPVMGVPPELDHTSFSRKAIKPSEPITKTVPDSSSSETKSGTSTSNADIVPETGGARNVAGGQVDLFVDAAPRSIVRALDDSATPSPDPTRTGTVPDTEYDAALAQAQDIIEAVNNSKGRGNAVLFDSVEDIPTIDEHKLLADVEAALDDALQNGTITQEVFEGFTTSRSPPGTGTRGRDQRARVGRNRAGAEGETAPQVDLFVDAVPRSIVRALDDSAAPSPDPTRTGTVPDTEYDAALAQAQDIIDDQGAFATVNAGAQLNLAPRARTPHLRSHRRSGWRLFEVLRH